MANFPVLNSGAVAQYPASSSSGQAVEVIAFLDGTDQRYLTQGRSFRKWEVKLNLLTDNEIAAMEDFFVELQGNFGTFTFPDPFSGLGVANCRLGTPDLISEYEGVNVNASAFWVIETNG